MLEKLLELQHAPATLRPNYILIPVTVFKFDRVGIESFNAIYNWLSNSTYNTISRTSSGGISFSTRLPAYDVLTTTSMVEITILNGDGCWRIQIRPQQKEVQLYGHQAYIILKKELLKDGIDLSNYEKEDGLVDKMAIQKPLIKLFKEECKDKIYEKAHHIDFHSSYAAGLSKSFPEFAPTLKRLYAKRIKYPKYKAVLNLSIGYFQSEKIGYRLSHLSKAAIADNNARLTNLAVKMAISGRTIIAFNTDGLWYSGEIYHGDGEGTAMGQWQNDHINCKLRYKSAGAYEYIENGVYKPVVRGYTLLDEIKNRDDWEWGDIYHSSAEMIKYKFDFEKGIVQDD